MTHALHPDTQQHVRFELKSAFAYTRIDDARSFDALLADLLDATALHHVLATAGPGKEKDEDVLASVTYDPHGFRLEEYRTSDIFYDGLLETPDRPLRMDANTYPVNDRCHARLLYDDIDDRRTWRLVLIDTDPERPMVY